MSNTTLPLALRPKSSNSSSLSPPLIIHANPNPLSVQPITPLGSSRYDLVEKDIPPKRSTFPSGRHNKGPGKLNAIVFGASELPSGWVEYIHPDGRPYFRNGEWKTVTEVNVRDTDSFEALAHIHSVIDERWRKHPVSNDPGRQELYLAIDFKSQQNYYYFVEHDAQDIFWLEELRLDSIIGKNWQTLGNYELFVLRNYYGHLENFPCHNNLPKDAVDFLRSSLTYICTDHMTSGKAAVSPWSPQDAKDFLDMLNGLDSEYKENVEQANLDSKTTFNHIQSHRTWFVARLLSVILHSQLVHKHGTTSARTDRLQLAKPSVPGAFDYLAGSLTFFAHFTYVQRFERVWIGGIASTSEWETLLNSLLTEWPDSNLLATVMLSANMAFLAIQNLTQSATTMSIVSTFFSIGSIVIGLHHVWRFRDKQGANAREAGAYFRNAARLTGNLRLLAFFLSLPITLLSWSMVSFACSVSIYAFHSQKAYFSSIILAIMFGAVSSAVAFFWGVLSID